jgi:hypothetical protein
MFEISPIFNDSVECQLFILMTFFDSRKDLTCMVVFLAGQSMWAAIGGRDFTPYAAYWNCLQDA